MSILTEGLKDGSVRKDTDVEQLASIILGSMRFNVLQWRLSNFEFNLNEKGDKLCETLNLLIKHKN